MIVDIVSSLSLALGAAFVLIGAFGLLRFPDFFTRLHAVSVTDTLGTWLILFGLALHAGFGIVLFKLLLIWAFLLVTSPTASHALAKAALHGHVVPMTKEDSN